MGISSIGVGSGLDVDGLISKLMAAESASLSKYDKQTAAYQYKIEAFGKLSSSLGAFQGSLSSLTSSSTFKAVTASTSDEKVVSGSATSEAAPGTYKVNVTQLAQAQSLNTAGRASMTTMIGSGAPTTLTFQFGTLGGGSFGTTGSALPASVAAGGIGNGALTINGTAIVTDGATRSAKMLADAVNAQSGTTGVTAMASQTATSASLFGGAASTFGAVATGANSTYALSVGGVQIAAQGNGIAANDLIAGVTAATIDATLSGSNATTVALAAANITFTGTVADGNLQFFAADGSNINITETVTGTDVKGGIGNAGVANPGSSVTATSGIVLTSASGSPIAIGGSAPALAGLAAGSGGSYLAASFTQDGAQASGTVVLGAGDQSLQGIRDAINKANIGVTASIVSDGSASPYRLVLNSTKTGANATMKISLSGDGGAAADTALTNLLAYDPAGVQNMNQTSAAQSTLLNVNGIAITSNSSSVSDAIQGVTLNASQVGSATLTIAKDSATVKNSVEAFVKAYNELNKTIKSLTSYDAESKRAGPLVGDATIRSIQTQLRAQLGTAITGSGGSLTTLSQIGIAFQKDGGLAVDSGKLQKAVSENFADIGGLFAAIATTTDGLVKFASSTSATKPGTYGVFISQVATKGTLTGTTPLAATTTIAPNTTWSVTLNQTDPVSVSKIANIALTAGTYSQSELSALLRAAINGHSAFAQGGDSVETSVDALGNLSISSSRYGSVSNIAIASMTGTAVSDIFGTATPTAGADVAGTIGGSPATGSGQTLTGSAGSNVEGLKLDVTGDTGGDRGTVTFSQGYAYQLNNLAASFMGTKGLITGKADGLNSSVKSVAKSREAMTERLEQIEKRYRAQFTALDTMLASMQSMSSYLTQQLSALANNSN